jgi:putative FmdB family regulatory protein
MPIYEYRCDQGHTFEVMRRIDDDPVVTCETCSAPVERVFRPIAVHFKGKGFYNTDYGTRKRAREMEAQGANGKRSEGASGESKAGESTAAEAKPAEAKKAPEKAAAAPEKKSPPPKKPS